MTTHEELIEALDAKGADPECPSCGRNEWTGMGERGEAFPMMLLSGVGEEGIEGFGVLGVYCANCGLVRLHRKDSLGLD